MKGTTLTYYMSLWLGLIIVSGLLGLMPFEQYWSDFLTNPIQTTINLLIQAFTDPLMLTLMAGTAIVGIAFSGAGFGIWFIVPFVMIINIMTLFMSPTLTILSMDIPTYAKTLFTLFMFALNLLTIVSFTRGGA